MLSKEIVVKVKRIHSRETDLEVALPAYATPGAAGMDVCACLREEIVIPPGQRGKIPTGLAIELPGPEVVALVCARSGLAAKHGISLTNAVGVIDSDYRGEIQILLSNHGSEAFTVKHGDRIAQMLFAPVFLARMVEADALEDSERGGGGFGSTGR